MYNLEQAKAIVNAEINKDFDYDDEIIIIEESIREKPYGWIFYYQSKKYLETDSISYALAGNAPIIFEKETGRMVELGTGRPTEEFIELYEKGEWNVYVE